MPRTAGCALLGILLSAVLSSPVAAQAALLDDGAKATLMDDVRWLADDARQGRREGSPENAAVRQWLVGRFREVGLYAAVQPFDLGDGKTRANVVATVEGSAHGGRAIVATAHYDHLGVRRGAVYNGADDNASGVAALLALGARLVAHPPRHTVVLAALDAEESGLRGAYAFVDDSDVPLDSMVLNVNLDMVGRSAAGELYASGTRHYPHLREILEPVAEKAPVTLRFGHDDPAQGGDDWTSQSDHWAFHQVGVPYVYFGVEDHPDYHRPTDDAERIEPTFFAAAVETVIMAVEALDGALGPEGG